MFPTVINDFNSLFVGHFITEIDSLYFEKGQRFQFNLVNKELDKNEIPYLHLLEENVS